MVTNAHCNSLEVKLEMTETGDYFDHLISAHDFDLPKEDIRTWSEIQTIQPYDPKHTLLVDDNLHALNTARKYGIQHLLCAVHVSPAYFTVKSPSITALKSPLVSQKKPLNPV